MSRAPLSAAEEDDRQKPQLAASIFDFLLIELVPLAYRTVAELNARDEAALAAAQYPSTSNSSTKTASAGGAAGQGKSSTLVDRTLGKSADGAGAGGAGAGEGVAAQSGGTATTGSLAGDRTSVATSNATITNMGTEGSGMGITGGGSGIYGQSLEGDDEETREKIFFRLDALGYRVGQGLVERFSADQPRPATPLDCIKFVCKELWTRVFRKQIDNLKTNHRGTFVLTDSRFQPLHRMSVDRRLGPRGVDEAVRRAQAFLYFPCGVIRGALSGLGLDVIVHAETTDIPIATFQIRTVGSKP